MKISVFGLVGLAVVLSGALPQNIIENPDKALSPNAGRVLQLKEVIRLSDESGKFFFKYPRFVRSGPDGSLVIRDVDQLLRFDARGTFLGNVFRKGQGPGEMNFVSNVAFDGEALIVHSSNPEKLVWLDKNGQLIRDVSLNKAGGRVDLLFSDQKTFYFLRLGWPAAGTKFGLGNREGEVISVSPDGQMVKKVAAFPNRFFWYGGAMMWDGVLSVPLKGRYLAVSCAPEYTLRIYDCPDSRLLRLFKRKYKRVASSEKNRGAIIGGDGTRYEMPGAEWQDDIAELYEYRDQLWVRTSTVDDKKGILIDIYDLDGRYIDAVYLKTNGRLLGIENGILFIRETTADETIEIAGYRIDEGREQTFPG